MKQLLPAGVPDRGRAKCRGGGRRRHGRFWQYAYRDATWPFTEGPTEVRPVGDTPRS
ncbi:hypothetical protein [Streptomyces sp. E5N91]|uniref:hypothetical protein n=1 Tax=Streptomyces sp. E5N91 TaxID=1851996 RepID=UPI00187D5EE5|nr:hypothetical protein [Streptomyces sp. E5N91]